jgi:hypothetical protein
MNDEGIENLSLNEENDVPEPSEQLNKSSIFKEHFTLPVVPYNPDGWGPCELPDQFKDIPYQPFSKGDRIGKVGYAYF